MESKTRKVEWSMKKVMLLIIVITTGRFCFFTRLQTMQFHDLVDILIKINLYQKFEHSMITVTVTNIE